MVDKTQILFFWLSSSRYADTAAVEAYVKGSDAQVGAIYFAEADSSIWIDGVRYGIDKDSFNDIAANKSKITNLTNTVNAISYFNAVAGNSGGAATVPTGTDKPQKSTLNITGTGAITTVSSASGLSIQIDNTKLVTGTTPGSIKIGDKEIVVKDWATLATSESLSDEIAKILGTANDTSEEATVYGAKKAAAEALSAANTAQTTANSKVASVTATTNAGIAIGGTATAPTVGIKIDSDAPGNVTLSTGANGLKANVTIPDATVKSVKSGDKVLALTNTELSTTINLTYDSTAKKIKLTGIGSAEIASIDATQFIKDGMISDAELVSTAESGVTGIEAPYIKITFNTDAGKEPVRFSVKSLVDVYTGANVKLASITAATTYEAPKAGESVDTAIGKLIKGIADAKTSGVTSFDGKTGIITLKASGTANGTVNLTMANNELSAAIVGLGSAAYTETSAYATAAQGTKADNALQSVSANGSNYITASAATKTSNAQAITVSATIQKVSDASETANGLAEASDVKTYVDDSVKAGLSWHAL